MISCRAEGGPGEGAGVTGMFEIILSIAAGVVMLALSLYLVARKWTLNSAVLALGFFLLALIEVLDQLSFRVAEGDLSLKWTVLLLESLLPAVLLFYSLTYSRRRWEKMLSPLWLALLGAAVLFPVSVMLFPMERFFYSPDLRTERLLFLGRVGYWFYIGAMLYCVVALMNLETTFSATTGSDRWRVKYEVIGVASIMAVLIFYFSQGLLYRTINMNILPVRSGVMIVASLLVGYSRIIRGNGVRVTLSRYILYRSVTLLVVGLYLLILGLVGGGMRYFGVSFSKDLTIFMAFVMGIGVMVILFSEQLRRRVTLFIGRHFYAQKHDYRSEWLKFTGRLSACRTVEEAQSAILSTFRETFGLNMAAMFRLEREGRKYAVASNQGVPGVSTPLPASTGLISHLRESKKAFVPYGGKYTLSAEEASFVGRTGASAVVPLEDGGRIEGFVILGDPFVKGDEFIQEDYALMDTFAKQATLCLLNFRLSDELAETREIAAVAKISSFVIHDLKNLTSSLSLMLENAEEYIREPEFQSDMISSVKTTVTKMRAMMERLKGIPEKRELNIAETDISILARETIEELMKARPGVEIRCEGLPAVSMVDGEEMRKVLQNLLLNALDATEGNGAVRVETGLRGGKAFVSVDDRGCGMSEEFISESLFKPFRTTKKKGLGIGLYQCKQIVEAHGGMIEVRSEPGKGSLFVVYVPAVRDAEYVA